MTGSGRKKQRDPAAQKARDLKRQRKIVSVSSDKAARRHSSAIKAMENRRIRRTDRNSLTDDNDESADNLKTAHNQKRKHLGTENSAIRRNSMAKVRDAYQKSGGRTQMSTNDLKELRSEMESRSGIIDRIDLDMHDSAKVEDGE